jgi:hypothetical protein
VMHVSIVKESFESTKNSCLSTKTSQNSCPLPRILAHFQEFLQVTQNSCPLPRILASYSEFLPISKDKDIQELSQPTKNSHNHLKRHPRTLTTYYTKLLLTITKHTRILPLHLYFHKFPILPFFYNFPPLPFFHNFPPLPLTIYLNTSSIQLPHYQSVVHIHLICFFIF